MDVLMCSPATAARALTEAGIPFKLTTTRPCSKKFDLLDDHHYVIRQTIDNSGACLLVIAAKMGKEVH